jgi:hypothetical protein
MSKTSQEIQSKAEARVTTIRETLSNLTKYEDTLSGAIAGMQVDLGNVRAEVSNLTKEMEELVWVIKTLGSEPVPATPAEVKPLVSDAPAVPEVERPARFRKKFAGRQYIGRQEVITWILQEINPRIQRSSMDPTVWRITKPLEVSGALVKRDGGWVVQSSLGEGVTPMNPTTHV